MEMRFRKVGVFASQTFNRSIDSAVSQQNLRRKSGKTTSSWPLREKPPPMATKIIGHELMNDRAYS